VCSWKFFKQNRQKTSSCKCYQALKAYTITATSKCVCLGYPWELPLCEIIYFCPTQADIKYPVQTPYRVSISKNNDNNLDSSIINFIVNVILPIINFLNYSFGNNHFLCINIGS
jgi:hypothetical protein